MRKAKRLNICFNVIAVLGAVILLFPLFWIIINSLKTETEMFQLPIKILPSNPTLTSYITLIKERDVLRAALNSLIIAVGGLTIGMTLGVCAAYGLAMYKMKATRIFLFLFLVTQMLPASLILTPLYLTYNKIHILNTYLAPIFSVATISIPFVVITTRPFFLALPKEVEEAAKIDGCNAFQSFYKVMLPIAKPGLFTAGALSFVYGWNDLIYSMTFLTKDHLKPLTNIFYKLMPVEGIQWGNIMALATIVITPIVVVFLVLQDYIVEGLASGAVKE